jgi:hypothetical protein
MRPSCEPGYGTKSLQLFTRLDAPIQCPIVHNLHLASLCSVYLCLYLTFLTTGIHGNDNLNVVIRDVTFHDFEVAAASLNKVDGLLIENCKILRNRHDLPVVGMFSAARFMRYVVAGCTCIVLCCVVYAWLHGLLRSIFLRKAWLRIYTHFPLCVFS